MSEHRVQSLRRRVTCVACRAARNTALRTPLVMSAACSMPRRPDKSRVQPTAAGARRALAAAGRSAAAQTVAVCTAAAAAAARYRWCTLPVVTFE